MKSTYFCTAGALSGSRRAAVAVHAKQQQRQPAPQPQHTQQQQQRSSRAIAAQAVATDAIISTATTTSSGWLKSLLPFGRKQREPLIPTISRAELELLLQAQTAPAAAAGSCSQAPLVVVFSATWCGPCKVMMQRMENIAKQLGPRGVKVVKIDTGGQRQQPCTRPKLHRASLLSKCFQDLSVTVKSAARVVQGLQEHARALSGLPAAALMSHQWCAGCDKLQ